MASPEQGDLRFSGPPSGQGAGGGAQICDRRVPADLKTDSLATVQPMAFHLTIHTFRKMASTKTMTVVAVLVLLCVTLSIAPPGVSYADCIGSQGVRINHGGILVMPISRNNYCRHILCSNGSFHRTDSGECMKSGECHFLQTVYRYNCTTYTCVAGSQRLRLRDRYSSNIITIAFRKVFLSSNPVHSLMFSSQRFFCLPLILPPFTSSVPIPFQFPLSNDGQKDLLKGVVNNKQGNREKTISSKDVVYLKNDDDIMDRKISNELVRKEDNLER
ncbi:hypothetical protein PoB_003603300 [Plakobranchus ocellatus]|uniref:Uncharacterized protein n=1 Tax=Plakobranchus ocellatus TaxID=259542 RepID=A0AAV4ART7_9GAST|nr:hypothetical protein PoB_003603300 [Plakobranchus ocellatus]